MGYRYASYQIEGAWDEDGKSESIWDRFSHTPGMIKTGDTGDVACDFYHRYREDIALMAELGLNAARISLSWPRIIPNGKGAVNPKGIDFYNRVIDELLKHNLKPFVTLYHWDLPQILEDTGGWANRDLANYFSDYAALASKSFGDRVKHWMSFNEPWIFTVLGYMFGIHAPGRRDRRYAMKAGHVINLAQGMATRAIRENSKPDMVGAAFSMQPIGSHSDSVEDREAAERYHRFNNVWFLETAMEGRYPKIFLEGSEEEWLDIQPGDMEIIKAPLDFIGINLYTRMTIAHDPHDKMMGTRPAYPGEENELTDFGWEVYPRALSEMILRISRDYPGIPIYVTENGASYGEAPEADGKVHDQRRIKFLRGYIAEMGLAIAKGADVRGYFLWTFTDNFEWAEGFGQRFGIVYCDFKTQLVPSRIAAIGIRSSRAAMCSTSILANDGREHSDLGPRPRDVGVLRRAVRRPLYVASGGGTSGRRIAAPGGADHGIQILQPVYNRDAGYCGDYGSDAAYRCKSGNEVRLLCAHLRRAVIKTDARVPAHLHSDLHYFRTGVQDRPAGRGRRAWRR